MIPFYEPYPTMAIHNMEKVIRMLAMLMNILSLALS